MEKNHTRLVSSFFLPCLSFLTQTAVILSVSSDNDEEK
jgi:hypothetical protein